MCILMYQFQVSSIILGFRQQFIPPLPPLFLGLKSLSPGQFWGSSNSRRYHWNLKLLVATLKSEVWEQNCVWLFCYFNFERNYDVLKSKSPCILLNKNINFNKNEAESKMENPTHSFKETNLVLKLILESQIKSKTVKQNRAFFVPFVLSKLNFFFNICISSQCIVHWIHFQNIHTFTYQKTLLHTLLLLVFKIVESLQCILKLSLRINFRLSA